jgi:hypothetical protein
MRSKRIRYPLFPQCQPSNELSVQMLDVAQKPTLIRDGKSALKLAIDSSGSVYVGDGLNILLLVPNRFG